MRLTPNNNLGQVVMNYCLRHLQAALSSLGQLSRTPLSTSITCVVIGIALALPLALFVLLKNVDVLSHNFQQTNQVTLYLKNDTTATQVQDFLTTLKNTPGIAQASAISPEQGLQELEQQAGMSDVMTELSSNPLPWALVVLPSPDYHTPAALISLSDSLKQNPLVDSVQMDLLWAQRLLAVINLAHRFIYALTAFLALGVLLIVNNCIRSATQHNKKEIDIIKLIGGTPAFIRRPFLYAGIIYGLLGGIIAWQFVDLLLLWIKTPSNHLASLYQSQYQLLGISLKETFYLLFSSILLGLGGAWFAVTRHLHTPRL